MPATATTITPSRSSGPDAPSGRRPFRDNPRLILAGIAALLIALVAIVTIANRSTGYSPDFLSEVVLYALTAADLTMLVALAFVLARNIVKLVVERRRGLLFARFRAKLVALLLGMTLVPAILVLAVGSELLQASVERWFNAPMDDLLASANQIAGDYYQERQAMVSDQASRIARTLAPVDLAAADAGKLRELLAPDNTLRRVQTVALYRVTGSRGAPDVQRTVDVAAPALPPGYTRRAIDRLAAQ